MSEHKPMTREEMDAIKKRTDAITPGPWLVYYVHVPEDISRLLAEVERLNKEADWLANIISTRECANHDISPICHQEGRDCRECFRNAARKAVQGKKVRPLNPDFNVEKNNA